jgi:hypothetical protein
MATLVAGLVLGLLVVSLLPAQTALAAGEVADELCLGCIYEATAARYGGLAEFYAAKLEIDDDLGSGVSGIYGGEMEGGPPLGESLKGQ